MTVSRYILLPYKGRSSRLRCPNCGKPYELAPYLDKQSGALLADHVGRCNRENRCGYHYTPKEYFADNGIIPDNNQYTQFNQVEAPKPVDSLPLDLLKPSLAFYDKNNLFQFFMHLFGKQCALDVFATYLVGTSNHWKGATLYPQIDINENYRQCKIILHDAVSGKRIREGAVVDKYNRKEKRYETIIAEQDCSKVYGRYLTDATKELNLEQCYFGEHLLKENPDKTVAILESEKGAMVASVYKPEYVWIATGGKYGCKWNDYAVCKALEGRNVIMFPDAYKKREEPGKKVKPSPYEVWCERAANIQQQVKCKIYVSDLLENISTEEQKAKGWDLLDYLLIENKCAL